MPFFSHRRQYLGHKRTMFLVLCSVPCTDSHYHQEETNTVTKIWSQKRCLLKFYTLSVLLKQATNIWYSLILKFLEFFLSTLWQTNGKKNYTSGVISRSLNHSTIDILGRMTAIGSCPVHYKLFSSMAGLHPLDVSRMFPAMTTKCPWHHQMYPGREQGKMVPGWESLLHGLIFKGRMRKVCTCVPIKVTEFSRLFTWAIWLL